VIRYAVFDVWYDMRMWNKTTHILYVELYLSFIVTILVSIASIYKQRQYIYYLVIIYFSYPAFKDRLSEPDVTDINKYSAICIIGALVSDSEFSKDWEGYKPLDTIRKYSHSWLSSLFKDILIICMVILYGFYLYDT